MSSLIKPLFRLTVVTFICAMLMPVTATGQADDFCVKHPGHKKCNGEPPPEPPPPEPPPPEPPSPPPPDETVMATFKLCTGSRSGESGRSIEVTENGKTTIKRIRCD